MRQRRTDVVALALEDVEPRGLPVARQFRLRLLGQVQAPLRVRSPRRTRVTGLREPLGGILAHRLEQAVAHLAVALLRDDEGRIDEALEQVRRAVSVAAETDAARRREREAA